MFTEQAILLGRHLAAFGPPIAAAWCSTAVRACDTAHLVLQQLQVRWWPWSQLYARGSWQDIA